MVILSYSIQVVYERTYIFLEKSHGMFVSILTALCKIQETVQSPNAVYFDIVNEIKGIVQMFLQHYNKA